MKKLIIALIIGVFFADSLFAMEMGEVDIHGFISQGYLQSTENNYLADTKDGTFEFNEMGLNFTTQLLPNLRAGIQLLAKDLGPNGNDEVIVDYAYGDYKWKDWAGLRAGILKIPFGLYNETRDVDILRTSIFLPQSIYNETFRDVFGRMKGVGLYGDISMGKGGTLTYNAQVGTQTIPKDGGLARTIEGALYGAGLIVNTDSIDVKQKYVAKLGWATPLEGLRIAAAAASTKLDMQLQGIAETPFGPTPVTIKSTMDRYFQTVYSAEYVWNDLTVAGEFSLTDSEITSTSITNMGSRIEVQKKDQEGYYGSLSYRINHWLEVGSYYSVIHIDRPEGETSFGNYMKDWTLSTRFDINEYWILKLEGHVMRGTAFLNNLDHITTTKEPNSFLGAAKITFTF